MSRRKPGSSLRVLLLAMPFILVAGAASASDLYRLESRLSYIEGQIRDLRMQRPIERSSVDTAADRRMRMLETEIVALKGQVHALENRVAELSRLRPPPVAPKAPPEALEGKQ